jgi:tetratricopeptide (TPR) repeat protein
MGIVYRAEHATTREPVAIKTVRVRNERQLESLRREVYALGRIRHPGVVRILEEGVHEGVPWYAMELLSGETLSDFNRRAWDSVSQPYPDEVETRLESAEEPIPPLIDVPLDPTRPAAAGALPRMLAIIRQLCASLAFLHGEGIVHRDLKSANVLLRDGVRPVLIDFGLVWRFPGPIAREVIDVAAAAAGTVGYMAPEQIAGDLVDARADLYAVGCILYETLTGRLPHRRHLSPKTTAAPIPPSHLVVGIPAALDDLVMRLLEPRARDRLGHADDIVRVLDTLLGPAADSVRYSHSQAPRPYVYRPVLAGREKTLAFLTDRLQALEFGRGGCVLLGGESGIGKTSVAMALAKAAAARGLQVVAGACLPLGASEVSGRPNETPFHPFGRLFDAIADRCVEHGPAKTDRLLGRRGKILAACEPRLADLPGQEFYPSPPEVPAQAAQQRLFGALAETLGAYADEWPVLLVLDDLQWADELSLRFLSWLDADYFDERGVLIVATYRAEETSLALRDLAARAHVAHEDLGPLDRGTMSAIAADMLGLGSPPPAFVEELAAKAEGNPFFVGEYLRAAVEEGVVQRDQAGRWTVKDDRALPLPASLRDLVRRRLEGLTHDARALLETVSVLGRDLDFELLAAVRGIGAEITRAAVRELLTRQILEESEPGTLRFLHDKLREYTYEQVDPRVRGEVHLAAAVALERRGEAYPASLPALYPRLAHHFSRAGNAAKAIVYLDKAGEQAIARFANRDAIRFFREALSLDGGGSDSSPVPAALALDVKLRRAGWERRLADAHYALGELDLVLTHGRRALAWLGRPLPESDAGWVAQLLTDVPRQAVHRLRPDWAARRGETQRAVDREASIACQRLAVRFYYNFDALPMIASSLRAVNFAERAGGTVSAAATYGMLGMAVGISKLHALGNVYADLARETGRKADDRAGLVFALYAEAGWRVGDGDWRDVRALCRDALEIGEAGGLPDPQDVAIAETLIAHVEFYLGRFEESQRMYSAIEASARARDNGQFIAWGLYAAARALIPLGRLVEARTKLEEAHERLEKQFDAPSRIICPGLLASLYLALGERQKAVALADLAAARIRRNLPTVFSTVAGYVGTAEVYLAEWERARNEGSDVGPFRRAARSVILALSILALNIPIGRPYYHRIRGRELRIAGADRSARRAFTRALGWAERLAMPYEEALARAELAALAPAGSAARHEHRRRAETMFAEMQCAGDLARIAPLAD